MIRLYLRKYSSYPNIHVPSGCCLTSDIRSSLQHESCPAFIRPFLFFTRQQMVKPIHTRSLTLMLQHPEEPFRLLFQLFLFFTPNFYSSDTSFITPRGCTWKWLLFRPYLTGKKPLQHKCGLKTPPPFCNNYSLSRIHNCEHQMYFLCQLSIHCYLFFFLSVCGKHPPWSMWRELLPCNETSCRSGIRKTTTHTKRLHTHVLSE